MRERTGAVPIRVAFDAVAAASCEFLNAATVKMRDGHRASLVVAAPAFLRKWFLRDFQAKEGLMGLGKVREGWLAAGERGEGDQGQRDLGVIRIFLAGGIITEVN